MKAPGCQVQSRGSFVGSGSPEASFPRPDSTVTLPSPTPRRAGLSSRVSSLIDQEPMDLSALWFPTAPGPPPSGISVGRWAVPSFLFWVPWARLPRPAPLFPRSSLGQSPGGCDTSVSTAGAALRTRGTLPLIPSALFHAGASLAPPLWQLSGHSTWRAGSAPRGPGSDPVGSVPGGRESEVGTAYSRPEDPHLRPGAGFQAAGGARQVCSCCARAEDAAWCVPSCLRVCACARRGDGARAGRAARAARRRGRGGGLGPDGDRGRRRCGSTGGDSHRG